MLGVMAACSIGGCENTVSNTQSGASNSGSAKNGGLLNEPKVFKGIDWTKLALPGRKVVSPGMTANSYCEMTPFKEFPSKHVVIYYLDLSGKSLAIVPATCAAYNQSPTFFFLFGVGHGSKPRLLEVIYEGNISAKPLTQAVPTASIAASEPHGWSGLFIWDGPSGDRQVPIGPPGVQIQGKRLIISGLVIPVGGTPPTPSYSYGGMVTSSYIYRWTGNLFRFIDATAGVPPNVPQQR